MQISRKIREVDRRRMVSVSGILLAACLTLAAATAMAQTNLSQYVQHVIVIVQENRTPTNLFQQDTALINNGAHIVSASGVTDECSGTAIILQPTPLFTCWDPDHSHASWTSMWHKGAMNGACNIQMECDNGTCPGICTDDNLCYDYQNSQFKYCSYTYALNTQWNGATPFDRILDPYFQIASQFGYANYMFQTNQGPSFPAHQFLFSGTSAPNRYGDSYDSNCGNKYPCHQWFDAENTTEAAHDPYPPQQQQYDCVADVDVYNGQTYYANAYDLDPMSDAESFAWTPPWQGVSYAGFPCYTHNSLPTLLGNTISWRYYLREGNNGYGIWTAPAAIYDICGTPGPHGICEGNSYQKYVQSVFPGQNGYDYAPILDDIENCNLPQVSWVIPDGNWSDHAGGNPATENGDGGPSWVGWIVNAVGNNGYNGCTDMVNGNPVSYWDDTVILITWDDWGGYYDDVLPPDCVVLNQPCTGYFNGNTNGQQYVYGFRVPLLVVGAYAIPGYISGANVYPPNCQSNTYCHDFGSILNFIEYAFGTGGNPLGAPYGIAQNQSWPYADYFVMDKGPAASPYSLYDFFNFNGPANSFTQIQGEKYPEKCFKVPKQTGCFPNSYPDDPDTDAGE